MLVTYRNNRNNEEEKEKYDHNKYPVESVCIATVCVADVNGVILTTDREI